MNNEAEPMAYITRSGCGCVKLVTVDSPERRENNARLIADAIKRGETVERVTCAQVRTTHWVSECDSCRPTKPARRPAPAQQEMEL